MMRHAASDSTACLSTCASGRAITKWAGTSLRSAAHAGVQVLHGRIHRRRRYPSTSGSLLPLPMTAGTLLVPQRQVDVRRPQSYLYEGGTMTAPTEPTLRWARFPFG